MMEIRDGIYVKGSVQYSFSTTGNIYTNLVAMCNERISQDMVRSNQGEITDSGLVRMQRLSSGDRPIEVTLLYSSLPMTIAELRSDIPYRKHVRRSTLLSLWSVMDQILDRLAFPWYNEMRSGLLLLLDSITLGNQDLDFFRGPSVSDPTICPTVYICCRWNIYGYSTTESSLLIGQDRTHSIDEHVRPSYT
jgi:hypothetical protein